MVLCKYHIYVQIFLHLQNTAFSRVQVVQAAAAPPGRGAALCEPGRQQSSYPGVQSPDGELRVESEQQRGEQWQRGGHRVRGQSTMDRAQEISTIQV